MFFGIIAWIVIGLIVGFVATKVVNLRGDDPRISMGVTVGGAIVAGALFSIISGAGVTAWNPWAMFFAAMGGIIAVVAWHVVRSRTISHARYVPRRSY